MRKVRISVAALLSTAVVLMAAEIHSENNGGLTVHEWGTFTSVAGENGSAIDWDVLGGKDDLPGFVQDGGYRCSKWRLTGTVRMETPVIYFYSPREVTARVKVRFPRGLITEWYPNGDRLTSAIGWSDIKVQPDSTGNFPVEKSPSRYYAARGTESAPIAVGGQSEKFLFYRGVGRFAVPLSARVSVDGKIVVENSGAEDVPRVILFENRGGRLGYRDAGSLHSAVTLDAPSLDGSLAQLRNDLENALTAQGLFPREAQAMVETWRDSWFEEGSRLIYIVPAHAVDEILPLEVEPAPLQTARVFVGRIELITPEAVNEVAQAVQANDRSVGKRYGRFLEPILNRIAMPDLNAATALYRFRASIPFSSGCR